MKTQKINTIEGLKFGLSWLGFLLVEEKAKVQEMLRRECFYTLFSI
jgi:hypothetical protein